MPENKLPPFIVLILLFGALILSVAETGIAINEGDHPIHLSYVYKVVNPDLFPNDPFVATVEQYPSIFWKAIASFAKSGISVKLMLHGGHLLFRAIAIAGIFFLYREFSRLSLDGDARTHTLVAIAGVYIVLGFNVIHWGGTYMLEQTLETSTAAFSVLPWVWYLWVRRAWPAWAIAFGLVTWIHPMVGMYAGLIFACVWLAEGDLYNPATESGKRFWLKGGIPGAILSASAVVYAWLQRTALEPGMKEQWVVIARYRLGHHLFPSEWPLAQFAIWITIAIVLLAACVYTTRGSLRRILTAGFISVAALAVIGLLAPRFFPNPTLLSLCLWRSPMAWTVAAFGLSIPFALKLVAFFGNPKQMLWPAVVASFLFLAALSAVKYQKRQARAVSPERQALTTWIRESTPEDALFLAPPRQSGVRTAMRRTSFVEWKDGSAILWDAVYTADVWMARLAAIAGRHRIDSESGLERPPTNSETAGDYRQLLEDPERLRELMRENNLGYIITADSVGENFKAAFGQPEYQQGNWAVYTP